jgi:amino-acid N-acetyltransferase
MERASDVTVRPASASDLEAIGRLLEEAELPTAGAEEFLSNFVVAEADGRLLGVAGLEVHDRDGLLRSVAVSAASRGLGLGDRLTRRILDEAGRRGLRRVYLLTTTAADYFPRHGFQRIDREQASPEVKQSVEFREACPASAVAMVLDLATRPGGG